MQFQSGNYLRYLGEKLLKNLKFYEEWILSTSLSTLAHVLLYLGFLSQHGWGGTAVSLYYGRAMIAWLQEQVRAPSDFWNLQPKPSLWGSLKGKVRKTWEKGLFWAQSSDTYAAWDTQNHTV